MGIGRLSRRHFQQSRKPHEKAPQMSETWPDDALPGAAGSRPIWRRRSPRVFRPPGDGGLRRGAKTFRHRPGERRRKRCGKGVPGRGKPLWNGRESVCMPAPPRHGEPPGNQRGLWTGCVFPGRQGSCRPMKPVQGNDEVEP